ncbi:hypothetical protein CAEBREN_04997 [Caenorhabditis brenneri]|uniref:CX domain-containing protein n=1 Tax=Caenorhabditis brenneri TaxID=135651 RepID=G0MWR7_CAEBE|nr:hypothetical protein CAEBREN_04997 [Caenorhabditis brenneri]
MDKLRIGISLPRKHLQKHDCWSSSRLPYLSSRKSHYQSCRRANDVSFFFFFISFLKISRWNNRPYYWGSNYYRASPGHSNMCRMPIESGDPQFGNIYFQDNSRPREITWGCGYYEYCCGYECCRGGGSIGSDRIGGRGSSIGYALVIAFLARRLMF